MKNEAGFSMIELLIAMVILAIGLLAAASMQITAITSNAFASRLTVAAGVAQGVVEDMMARDPSDAIFHATVSGQTWDLDTATSATTISIPNVGTLSATYTTTLNTPATNVTRIVVTVTGGGRTVSITSYKRAI